MGNKEEKWYIALAFCGGRVIFISNFVSGWPILSKIKIGIVSKMRVN